MFEVEETIERPLGATENLYWRFDAKAPLNFGVVVRFAGALRLDELKEGLLALQHRHPLLRVRIQPDGQMQPWFLSGVGEIPLQVLQAAPTDAWRVLETEVNIPLDTSAGPLVRCVLLVHGEDDQTLVMTFHHAVSDGKSATFLIRDLLQSIKQQRQGLSGRLEPLPPVGYYGHRIPRLEFRSGGETFKKAWQTLKGIAQFLEGAGFPVGLQRAKEPGPGAGKGVMIEVRGVGPDITSALARRAKAEGASMQCVLNAALSLTVAEDSPTGFLQRTACSQVLDMRERLDPPVGEDCGLFATGATSLHALTGKTPFWSLTRRIHNQLQHSILTPMPFFHPTMYRQYIKLGDRLGQHDHEKFSALIGSLHPEGLAVSNLGRVTIDVADAPLQVTSFGFGTNTTALNYLSTSAATLGGQMIWSFNGCASLTRERLSTIADKTVARMIRALDEKR